MTRLLLSLLLALPLWAANGDITAIRVLGSTTGVAGTAESACLTASACTGWVAEIDIAGLSTGGTYALGIGANNSPAAAKIACTVTSSGYNASAVLGTTTRTVYGTHQLRQVYAADHTAPYPNDETVADGTLTLRIALSDVLYQGDTATCTITQAAGVGIYAQGGTQTGTVTDLSVTNNSTLTYSQARVIANWSWPGFRRITGNTLTVRAVGYGRHAQNGKPLAAMKFTATDPDGMNVSTTVTAMTIDPAITDAGGKVQEYIGTLNTSTCAQGKLVTVNFAGYPWVGDATSVMDTSDGVNTLVGGALYAPQTYICDRLGTFGTSAAVVEPTGAASPAGNDSTCVAVAESAFNGVDDAATAAPCLTINKALQVIQARNNATYTRKDTAGTVYLKAGTYTYTGASVAVAASSGTNADKIWSTITTFPGVAKTDVQITGITSTTYNKAGTTPLHIKGIKVYVVSGAPSDIFRGSANTSPMWLESNDLTMTSGSSLLYYFGPTYWTGNAVGSDGACGTGTTSCLKVGFTFYSGDNMPALVRGNNVTGIAHQINACTVLGNLSASAVSPPNTGFKIVPSPTATGRVVICTAPIVAYNKFMNLQSGSGTLSIFPSHSNVPGAAIVQNAWEINNGTTLLAVAADSSTGNPTSNVMIWLNTLAGGRINRCYNDSGTSAMLRTLWSEIGNVQDGAATKHDSFATLPNAGRVGAWACLYGIGWRSNLHTESLANPVAGQFQLEFPGLYGDSVAIGASRDAQASAQPPTGTGRANAYPAFVNRLSWDGTQSLGGNGDYHLLSTSPARGLVPSGKAVLPYDLDGVARRNDGTGAAGAYEYQSSGRRRPVTVIQ